MRSARPGSARAVRGYWRGLSEGFVAQATNLEGLKAIQLVWKFPRVAMRGPEPDVVSEYDADEFVAMLEGAEMVHPDDL